MRRPTSWCSGKMAAIITNWKPGESGGSFTYTVRLKVALHRYEAEENIKLTFQGGE